MHRLRIVGLAVVGLFLSGCSFFNTPTVVTQIVTPQPTNTLPGGLFSMTPKYTATLPPTPTDIPSITPVPTVTAPAPAATRTPTLSPTPPIYGVIPPSNPTVNLRSGAGSSFPIITGVKSGTRVIVLGTNEAKDWFNVRLDDGREGWLLATLVTVSNPDILPTLSTEVFVQRTSIAATIAAIGTEDTGGSPSATRRPGVKNSNDVLAYCRNTTNGEPKKTIPEGTPVFVYWSWFAKTPEQLQDHVNYATYTVTVDGQPLKNWKNDKTEVVRFPDGYYWVFWYVPIGTPAAGDHKIDYKLTWSQQITDGIKKYGPGGDEVSNSGTCVFTIK